MPKIFYQVTKNKESRKQKIEIKELKNKNNNKKFIM